MSEACQIKSSLPFGIFKDLNIKKCCEAPHLIVSEGEEKCCNCGLVWGQHYVSHGKRVFSKEEMKNRTQNEIRFNEVGARTVLRIDSYDTKGSTYKQNTRILFKRLSKINNSLIGGEERNFWEARPKLKMISSKLFLPNHIKQLAWKIYKLSVKKELIKGRSIVEFIAGALYVSARIHKFALLLEEISEVSLIRKGKIHKSVGYIVREVISDLNLNFRPLTIKQLIFRFGNGLDFPLDILIKAYKIYLEARLRGFNINGRDPRGIASACMYLSSKKPGYSSRTQKEIAGALKISEVTLRTNKNQLMKNLHIL